SGTKLNENQKLKSFSIINQGWKPDPAISYLLPTNRELGLLVTALSKSLRHYHLEQAQILVNRHIATGLIQQQQQQKGEHGHSKDSNSQTKRNLDDKLTKKTKMSKAI